MHKLSVSGTLTINRTDLKAQSSKQNCEKPNGSDVIWKSCHGVPANLSLWLHKGSSWVRSMLGSWFCRELDSWSWKLDDSNRDGEDAMGQSKYIVEEGSCTVMLLRVDGTCEVPFGGNLYSGWEGMADEKKEWTWKVDFAGWCKDDDKATEEEGDACQYLRPSGLAGNSGALLVFGTWREVWCWCPGENIPFTAILHRIYLIPNRLPHTVYPMASLTQLQELHSNFAASAASKFWASRGMTQLEAGVRVAHICTLGWGAAQRWMMLLQPFVLHCVGFWGVEDEVVGGMGRIEGVHGSQGSSTPLSWISALQTRVYQYSSTSLSSPSCLRLQEDKNLHCRWGYVMTPSSLSESHGVGLVFQGALCVYPRALWCPWSRHIAPHRHSLDASPVCTKSKRTMKLSTSVSCGVSDKDDALDDEEAEETNDEWCLCVTVGGVGIRL